MAQSDTIRVIVNGRGGHASQPNLTVDPVVVASHLVVAAQTVVSRSVDPRQAAVVSFTTVHGGSAHNIVPDHVTLTGTVRTLDADVQRDVKQRLLEVCEGTCRLFGASCAFEYDDGYPAVVNSPQMANLLAQAAADEFGAAQVSNVEPVMCGEDFAYYLRQVPGAFALLGIAGAALAISRPIIAGVLMIISAIGGLVVALLAYVLAAIFFLGGGILALYARHEQRPISTLAV
jgi:amidohydrolase